MIKQPNHEIFYPFLRAPPNHKILSLVRINLQIFLIAKLARIYTINFIYSNISVCTQTRKTSLFPGSIRLTLRLY